MEHDDRKDRSGTATHRPPHHRGMTSSAPRRRAALLDHHSPRGRASARGTARGRLAGRRFRLLYRPEGAEARNLDANPHVAVTTGSTGSNGWDSGKDVVVEGTAVRVKDAEALGALAAAWFAKYGDDWNFEVRGQEFVELSDSGGNTEEALGSTGSRPPRSSPGDEHGQTTYRF